MTHLCAVTILMTAISAVAILTSIAIVRRILMATSVLKVAAKLIGEVQALIIFPLIPYAILAVFYMFWTSAALHLFSSVQIVQNDCNSNCCTYDLVAKRVNCDRCCGYSIHYTPHWNLHSFSPIWVLLVYTIFRSVLVNSSCRICCLLLLGPW
ncbi:choline transporter protein 1-like [Trifolium pratense]|uniref:choline transporter protein 1-like n=1 Tax=Trifolium pratense TaxID=57577 RepID=UPI001E6933CD|nr:choline transporter protein 1-like [Trifolium pratense]